jgi:hypothetical protein
MLQAERSRNRDPKRWIIFFSLPNPSRRTMALGSTQPGIFLGGKRRPGRRVDLTAICEPTVEIKYGNLDLSQPYGPPRPVTGTSSPFF